MLWLYFKVTKFFKEIIFAVSICFLSFFVMLGINEAKSINFTLQVQNVLESDEKEKVLNMFVLSNNYNSSPNFFQNMRVLEEISLSKKAQSLNTPQERLKFMLDHSMCAMHSTAYPHSVNNLVINSDLNDILSRLFFVLKKPTFPTNV